MTKKCWRLLISCSFLIILLICSISMNAIAADDMQTSKVIRVGFPIQPGLTEVNAQGEYRGYTYEYLQTISQFAGWDCEFVRVNGTVNEQLETLMNMLKDGKIDVLGGMLKTDQTIKEYDFPQLNYGVAYSTLSVLETNTTISDVNLAAKAKNSIHIAVLQQAKKKIAILEQYCRENNFQYTLVPCENELALVNALSTGEADVILGVDLSKEPGTKVIKTFAGSPYYFMTTKGNTEIVNVLDDAMKKQEQSNPYFQKQLYEKYFGEQGRKFVLTEHEQTYVEEMKPLRVLISLSLAPFQYEDNNGKIDGITLSLLSDIEQQTGLKFQYIERDMKKTLSENIEEKEIDIVAGLPAEEKYASANQLILSKSYMEADTIMYSSRNFKRNQTNNNDKTKNVKKGIAAVSNIGHTFPGLSSNHVKFYDTLEECMDAVNHGAADYGYGNSYSVSYYMSEKNYPNVVTMQMPGISNGFCLGVLKDTDINVLTILNRAITTIDETQKYNYLMKEFDKGKADFSLLSYIRLHPIQVLTMGCILMLIILYLIYSRQKQVLLEAENEAKTRFLSNMSHEMRTPLSAIIGLNDLQKRNMEQGNIEEEENCIKRIDSSAKHLLSIINDVLDMGKINEGKLCITKKPFDIYEMLEDIKTIYLIHAEQHHIQFHTSFEADMYSIMIGDALRIKQVLINLISNAIKYNKPEGNVYFHVSQIQETEKSVQISFTVADTGVGIKEENIRRIFKAFEREERGDVSEGTGLGLAISNSVIGLMNSELKVHSKENEGSEFSFILELDKGIVEESDRVKLRTDSEMELTNIRVLIAEDNEINALIASKMLQRVGIQVEIVQDGELAVSKFVASKPHYFQLILMDIRMPHMDGLEATRVIRNLEREDASTIPIIALSANAFDEDIEKSKEAGMNWHLAKPIESQKLYEVIATLLKK
ncbi:MAG: transporter substrate-binding domain-containing protein [Lachnospiraceae bacterium]